MHNSGHSGGADFAHSPLHGPYPKSGVPQAAPPARFLLGGGGMEGRLLVGSLPLTLVLFAAVVYPALYLCERWRDYSGLFVEKVPGEGRSRRAYP